MPDTKLKSIEVKGKKFAVTVSSDDGTFRAEYLGEKVAADSLKQLTQKLQLRVARQSKTISIPFCQWDCGYGWKSGVSRLRTGVIVGIHAGNNNILLKYDDDKDGKTIQSTYGNREFMVRDKADELKRLGEARDKAEKEFDDFREAHLFNAKGEVRKLLGEDETA